MLHRLPVCWRQPQFRWGGVLAVLGAIERVWVWMAYQQIPYGDTGSYFRLAEVLSRRTLGGYDGTRVPAYPAFLALLNMDEKRVWIAQMALGWAISMLLFWLSWRMTNHAGVSALVGGLYNLIPGQFLFESNLLTETLTTFWIVVSFSILAWYERERNATGGFAIALMLGISASLSGMARPLFFPLTVWFLPFVWLLGGGSWRQRLMRLTIYCLGPILIQGGWLLYIQKTYHMFSPTTMAGYSLVQHTGEFFEYLPDDVAPIRDTYIRYRDAQIAERGVQTNAIWEAIPAMTKASGLGFYKLSRELHRLSILLIREHPDLYLRNVVEGWIAFWKSPVYWQPSVIRFPSFRWLLGLLAIIGRGISIVANGAFLLLSVLFLFSKNVRERLRVDRHSVAVIGFIWLISVVQTLVDHGDNPRFLVPLQMLVIYIVVRSAWFWYQNHAQAEVLHQ